MRIKNKLIEKAIVKGSYYEIIEKMKKRMEDILEEKGEEVLIKVIKNKIINLEKISTSIDDLLFVLQLRITLLFNSEEDLQTINKIELKILNFYSESQMKVWNEWLETKNPNILYKYAYMLEKGIEGKRDVNLAKELYWKNWEENKHADSLYRFAYILEFSYIEKNLKLAKELYWKNWKENKHSESLHNYAFMLQDGLGGEKDEKKARELFEFIWKNYGYKPSLYFYIDTLLKGIGGPVDHRLVRELYETNFDKLDYSNIYTYAYMLEIGLGGEKDIEKAKELYKLGKKIVLV